MNTKHWAPEKPYSCWCGNEESNGESNGESNIMHLRMYSLLDCAIPYCKACSVMVVALMVEMTFLMSLSVKSFLVNRKEASIGQSQSEPSHDCFELDSVTNDNRISYVRGF